MLTKIHLVFFSRDDDSSDVSSSHQLLTHTANMDMTHLLFVPSPTSSTLISKHHPNYSKVSVTTFLPSLHHLSSPLHPRPQCAILHHAPHNAPPCISAIASSSSKSSAATPSSSSSPTAAHLPLKAMRPPTTTNKRSRFVKRTKARQQIFNLFARAKQAERSGQIQAARDLFHKCLELDKHDAHSWLALARLEARAPANDSSYQSSSPPETTSSNSFDDLHSIQTVSNNSSEFFLSSIIPSQAQTSVINSSLNASSNKLQLSSSPAQQKSQTRTGSHPVNRRAIARRTFEKGLENCPDNIHLLHAWAVHEHRCGDRQRARNIFSQALRIDPGNSYVSHAWGLLEQRVGNVQRARDLFARSTEKRPNAEICVAWGMLEARDGRVDTARRIFEQGISAANRNKGNNAALALGNIYREWALAEERLGDLPRARELLSKAIAANPKHCGAYIALAKLEARRGELIRAVELARAATEVSPKPQASSFIAWGYIEMTSCNRPDKAREVFEKGIQIHPHDPALLQAFGTLEEKCGNLDEARRLFHSSFSAEPRAPTLVAWAMLEMREQQYEKARKLFEEAIATDPLHGAAYNAYGMMEARVGDKAAARKVFDRGVDSVATASLFHGYALFELRVAKDVDRARQLFRMGSRHSREDTTFVWHSWGIMEMSERCIDESRRVFAEGLRRYPKSSHLLVGAAMAEAVCASPKGTSYRSSSVCDVASVRDLFKKAVTTDPTHAHAWQTWGMFELRSGRKDTAVALFRRGLRLCPRHGALWQAWGVLETGRGGLGRARQLFNKGIEICGGDVHILQAWACLEVRANNLEKARELLDWALQVDGKQGAVWNAYGMLEARHGTVAKARQIFATGIRRSPGHAPLYRVYGDMEMRMGNYVEARKLFEKGLQVDGRYASLYHALAKLEGMFGNVDALAKLKKKAEIFFGTESEAAIAMQCGENPHQEAVRAGVSDEDSGGDVSYGDNVTLMESALDGGVVMDDF